MSIFTGFRLDLIFAFMTLLKQIDQEMRPIQSIAGMLILVIIPLIVEVPMVLPFRGRGGAVECRGLHLTHIHI